MKIYEFTCFVFKIIFRIKSKKCCKKQCQSCKYRTHCCIYAEKDSKMTNNFCSKCHKVILNEDNACEFYEE